MSCVTGEVLVVEDDPEINEMVGAYAQIAGFAYRSALCGLEGLTKAREGHPVLIVLDVMLPDVDGFEVCRRLKSADETAGIPVVLLTAMNREENLQRGRELGAAEYLTKPFDPDRLIRVIRAKAAVNPN